MTQVLRSSSLVAEYEYDGLGRRIASDDQSNVTHDYFNENWQILETRLNDQSGAREQNLWSLRFIDALIQQGRDLDGTLDESFGTDGIVLTDFGATDMGRRVAVQSDGKIVVVGHSGGDFIVARYNTDGSLDTSFDSDGKVTYDVGGTDIATAVAIDANGKILVAGGSGTYSVVVRFNSNGSVDTGFGSSGKALIDVSGGIFTETFFDIQVISGGKLMLAGYVNTTNNGMLVRLNSDGSLDTSFNGTGKMNIDPGSGVQQLYGLAVDGSGNIFVVGNGTSSFYESLVVAKYTSGGSLDTGFGTSGRRHVVVNDGTFGRSIKIDDDGKIVVSGTSVIYDTTDEYGVVVARLTSSGSFDTSFDSDGIASFDASGVYETGERLTIDGEGRILVAGRHDSDTQVVRVLANGSLDTSFAGDGIAVVDFSGAGTDQAWGVAVQSDDKVILAGGSGSGDVAVARLHGAAGVEEHIWFQQDANFNVTSITDGEGNVLERYSFTPYGVRRVHNVNFTLKVDPTQSDYGNEYGHQGGKQELNTGLIQFRYRWYHVTLGLWPSRDPAEYVDGMSLYQSAVGNPVLLTDPFGLAACSCGPDVTEELIRLRNQVRSVFFSKSLSQQRDVAHEASDVAKGWDMVGMLTLSVQNSMCKNGTGGCSGTVTVGGGNCYSQGVVNYFLAGVILSFHDTLSNQFKGYKDNDYYFARKQLDGYDAKIIAYTWWRDQMHNMGISPNASLGEEADIKRAFAEAGRRGILSGLPKMNIFRNCDPCKSPPDRHLQWRIGTNNMIGDQDDPAKNRE